MAMENMLNKIVEMDNEAKKIVDQAKTDKVKATKEVAESANKLKEKLLQEAERKIDQTKKEEDKKADNEIEKLNKKCEEDLKKMTALFENNKAEWVDTIIKRIMEA